MERTVTCINCPVGCRMTVILTDAGGFVSVTGNTCPRGAAYAEQECTLPVRTVTAVLPAAGSEIPLSVRTSRPVPKKLIPVIMRELSAVRVTLPVAAGQVILPDILGTGSDIVATRELK